MTDRDDNSGAQSAGDQAAVWFVRLRDADLTAADRRRYVHWLKRSPTHIAEFLRVAKLYKALKTAELPMPAPPVGDRSNVVEFMPRHIDTLVAPAPTPAAERHGSVRMRIAAAAGLVGLAAAIVVAVRMMAPGNTIETAAAEWRQFELSDGSIVHAGPRTFLELEIGAQRRWVRLRRGEAVFNVAKDAQRPFFVDAGELVVRAVGTQFGVERRDDSVTVTVAEGKVAVSPALLADSVEPKPDTRAALALTADEQVSVSRQTRAQPIVVQRVSATRELAWARGRLIFDSETVQEAVAEFNRRNRLQIAVDDPAIASRPACCVFDAADPESFAEAIAAAPDVALERDGSNLLRLVPENEHHPGGSAEHRSDSI